MKKYIEFDEYFENIKALTIDEKEEIVLKAKIVGEIVKARHSKGLSQKELAEISGVKQPVIARFETEKSDAQLSTILRILSPLGLTLSIVPKDQNLSHQ